MRTMETTHDTDESLCKAMRAELGATGHKAFALPYNRFDTERSPWWLSKEGANPAYHLPKLGFERPRRPSGRVASLVFEKGLEHPEARSRRMTDGWAWNRLPRLLTSSSFVDAITGLQARADVLVMVDARVGESTNATVLVAEGPRLRPTTKYPAAANLRALADVAVFADLPEALSRNPDRAFTWIDLRIGVPVKLNVRADRERADTAMFEKVVAPLWSLC